MYNIKGVTVKGYNFTATIEDSQLDDYVMSQLGISRDSIFETEIKVEGSFTVSNPDSDPTIEIDEIYLVGSQNGTMHGPKGYSVAHCEILPTNHPRQGMVTHVPQWGTIPTYNIVDLNQDNIDIDSLCDDILDQGDILDWISDRNASLCDYYHDLLMDR